MAQEDKSFVPSSISSYGTDYDFHSSEPMKSEEKKVEMDMKTKIGFRSGHVFNDIASNATTGYALLYYSSVIRLGSVYSGLIFIIGNIVDAFVVVATGFLIDLDIKYKIYDSYGKLKSWHLVGTLWLLVGYIPMLCPPPGIENKEHVTSYYTGFHVSFNIGYAIITVTHSAIISKLAISEEDQVTLSSIKNSGQAMSCIFIYLVAYFSFGNAGDNDLGSSEFIPFILITSIVGIATTSLFHLLIKETTPNQTIENSQRPSRTRLTEISDSSQGSISTMTKSQWLSEADFYASILIYAVSRAFFRVSASYLVFYVQYTLMLEKAYIAIVPLTMVLSGVVLSKLVKKIINIFGLEKSLIFFGVVAVGACSWIWFGCISMESKHYEVLGISALFGFSSYSMLVASLALVVRLIGKNLGK